MMLFQRLMNFGNDIEEQEVLQKSKKTKSYQNIMMTVLEEVRVIIKELP